MEAMQWEFEMQLIALETWTNCGGSRNVETSADETTEMWWICILGSIPLPVCCCSWSQVTIVWGHASAYCIAGTSRWWPAQLHLQHMRISSGLWGPLWRPLVGSRLLVRTQAEDPATWWVTTGICSSCWVIGLLGSCQATCGVHPGGGCTCIYWWSERPGIGAALSHGQWQVVE